MNKNSLITGVLGIVIGLIIGFFIANSLNKNALNSSQSVTESIAGNAGQSLNQADQGQPRSGEMVADVQLALDKAKNEPENYRAQIDAGKMYQKIQNFDQALPYFQKAQKLKPEAFEANALLGNAFLDVRQYENAETYYGKALEINPKDVTIRSDLASTYVQRTNPDYEKALSEFEKALEIDPNHEPTIYNIAIAYLRRGDKENAQKSLEKLKQTNPKSDLIANLEKLVDQ
jgi:Flp pilus assembly protein TadD